MERIPFDKEKELQIIGEYKPLHPRAPGSPRYNTPITAKENFKLLYQRKKPLWMPMSSDSITLIPHIVPDNVARGFVIDADPLDLKDAGGEDWFGIHWDYVPQVGGSMVRPGAPKVPDITRWEDYITFPDLEAMDWEGSAERNKEIMSSDRLNVVWIMNGLFERLISFMDFENAALAMVDEDEQEGVHRLFSALCDFYDKVIDKFKTYYNADVILFHDDWGSQRAPFFSLATVREMLVPYLSRVVESCHKRGLYFDFHSCGKNEMLVPAMIEAGVDLWTPQDMNDRLMLVEKYSDQLLFGIRLDLTMNSTEEDAKQAALKFFETFGKYPVVVSSMFLSQGAPQKTYEVLYELSRKAYN